HSASEISAIGVSVRWPAQFTSTSIGPSSCSVRSTRPATAPASATSSGMSVRATCIPAASSASAEAPPMPPPAPVTSATGLLNRDLLEPLADVDAAPAVEGPGHEVDDKAREEDPDVVDDAPPVAGAVRVLQAGVGILPEDDEGGHAGGQRDDADDRHHRDAAYPPADCRRLEHVGQPVGEE